MFPVCAGIETRPERVPSLEEMFPVCAGIEKTTTEEHADEKMFPVCAGIEIIRSRVTARLIHVSRVCGN